MGRRARGGPGAGGVCARRGAQTGQCAGVALHRGGEHGAGRRTARGAGAAAPWAKGPDCRRRLEEERALLARAAELLALATPPDRELPPFRAGDVKPPTRVWWQVRLPLAWAATVALALGIGRYLGREAPPTRQAETATDSAAVRGPSPAPPGIPPPGPRPARPPPPGPRPAPRGDTLPTPAL